jgi:hypothetical protein
MALKRTLLCVLVAGGSAVAGGCRHHDWASYGHDSSRRAHQVHGEHLNATTAKTLNFNTTGWMFQSTGGSFVASRLGHPRTRPTRRWGTADTSE